MPRPGRRVNAGRETPNLPAGPRVSQRASHHPDRPGEEVDRDDPEHEDGLPVAAEPFVTVRAALRGGVGPRLQERRQEEQPGRGRARGHRSAGARRRFARRARRGPPESRNAAPPKYGQDEQGLHRPDSEPRHRDGVHFRHGSRVQLSRLAAHADHGRLPLPLRRRRLRGRAPRGRASARLGAGLGGRVHLRPLRRARVREATRPRPSA